jgi:enoyl-CoA hydratase/carnithine racemase
VSDAPVALERAGGTHVVRLQREGNRFDEAFLAAFHDALDTIEATFGDAADTGDAAAVVTIGTGKAFSNGFDLEYLGELGGRGIDAVWDFVDRSCRLLGRVLTFPLPTVAAMNGHAFGIGGMLALAHDQRVMRDERGWFCLPEVDLGLSFHPFMQALITARLPARTAQEAILTGRRYDAASALAGSIVDASAPGDNLLARAAELAAPWTGKQPATVAALKSQLHAVVVATLER